MSDQIAIEKSRRESHVWSRQVADWYIEPEWCSARLFQEEQFIGGVLDPACGMGRIVYSARAAGLHAIGSDLEKRADGMMYALDFLTSNYPHEILMPGIGECKNVVTNPPFDRAKDFALCALAFAPHKVAIIFPTARLNAAHWIAGTPLRRIWLLTPRPSMPPGQCIVTGIWPVGCKPNQGGKMDYCWLVWERGYSGNPELRWLRRDQQKVTAA